MPQIFWKYKNKSGFDYEVSLYHGDLSKHVILYSGSEIIKIAFNISTNLNFSFMLGDELFIIKISYLKDKPKYTLTNKTTNVVIPAQDIKSYPFLHIIKAALLLSGFVVLILLLWRFL